MLSRLSAVCASLLAVVCLAQGASNTPAPEIRVFHDPALDILFTYPGAFTPVDMSAAKAKAADKGGAQAQCVRSILTAGSENKMGASAFVVSGIDAACPGVLKEAEQPDSFTKEQILRQLRRYGNPTLLQEPYRYSIDGRPAAVTLGSATPDVPAAGGAPVVTTYAAKACFLSEIPASHTKSSSSSAAKESGEVLCFDFTTQHRELLMQILTFTIKFGDDAPHPVVPGNALR